MSSGTTYDRKTKATSSGLSMSLVMFVLNIVVLHNTTVDGFHQVMSHGDQYHEFHKVMMWTAISMALMFVVLIWLWCVMMCSENERCARCTGGWGTLTLASLVSVLILQYVKMGEIWHSDPKHTMFWYGPYWSEGITHFPDNASLVLNTTNLRGVNATLAGDPLPHWPYIMSDVVIRIYGFMLMFLTVVLGMLCCCCGTAWCCGRFG